MNTPKIGFELKKVRLPLDVILPVRKIKNPHKTISRYQTIVASIKEIGLVEPLMVFPQKKQPGQYLIMDGHLRYHALKELGIAGDHFKSLFRKVTLFRPVERKNFRGQVNNLLTPKAARELLELCSSPSEPKAVWKARPVTKPRREKSATR